MKKNKLKFNAVDGIIVLLILAVIGAALYLFVFSKRNSGDDPVTRKTRIEYVFEVTELEEQYANAVTVGQPVEDAVWRHDIGAVVGVEATPYQKSLFDYESNTEHTATLDGYINLKITVEAEADESESAFTVNGSVIRVGEKYSIRLPEFYGSAFCIMLTPER